MKYILFFITLSCFSIIRGQIKVSSDTKNNLYRIAEYYQKNTPTIENIQLKFPKLPIYKVHGQYCLSTIANVESDFEKSDLNNIAFFGSRVGSVVTIKIPLVNVQEYLNFQNISFLTIAERIKPLNTKMTADLRVDSVWQGINAPQRYTGKNVLIGITDWGFDYDHPMFMDTSLSTSRVRAAWDHFKIEGNQPSMGYGVEYVTPLELDNANSDTASTYYDYATHGSHVAGIAGGSGAGLPYRGVAFEAEYLFNSVQLDVGSVIDAFTWMKDIANNDSKRLVINMSWGLYYLGTMDGTSLISQAINTLSDQGVVFVTSAGNNGNVDLHIKKEFNNDTISSRIGFYNYNSHTAMWGQSISMWGEPNKPFNSFFEIYDASNTLLGTSSVFNTQLNNGYFDSILVIGNDTVFYNYTIDQAHPQNQRPHIRLRVKNTNTAFNVVLNSYAQNGTVHYWNLVELSNGVGNWGMPFYSFGDNGVSGDRHYSLGEPSCTESAITVAAHASENVSGSGAVYPGSLASFSSEGPTYDERIKPDVSAPGVNVKSSINSYTTRSFTSVDNTTFNGRTYHFAAFSGTSMSSPATAGVVALILDANTFIAPSDVRNILRMTARQDNRTGTITLPGSVEWGMGKVTATDAIQMALTTVSIEDDKVKNTLIMYPNPVQNELVLQLNQEVLNGVNFEIYSIEGKRMFSDSLFETKVVDVSNFSNGIYIVYINSTNKRTALKFIKK